MMIMAAEHENLPNMIIIMRIFLLKNQDSDDGHGDEDNEYGEW